MQSANSQNDGGQQRGSFDESKEHFDFQSGGHSYEPGFENDVRYGAQGMRYWGGGNNYGEDWQDEDYGRCHASQRGRSDQRGKESVTMKTISAHELKDMLDSDHPPLVVNTLPSESFTKTHIPRSINIPQDDQDFVERVAVANGGRTQPVVVYCANEHCDSSEKAAKKLAVAGFSDIYRFEAGAEGWKEVGRLEAAAV